MALIPFAKHELIAPGSNDPRIKARIGILHVDAGNVYDLHDFFAHRSGGIEAHGHIPKDGTLFQYRDTAFQADANQDANDFALSFETQGLGSGEWTDAQIAMIKRVMLWAREVHGIPLRVVDTWNDPKGGWGYHTLFGAPSHWTPVSKSCPGPDRKKQFHRVLVPWMQSNPTTVQEDDMPLTDADVKKILDTKTITHHDDNGKTREISLRTELEWAGMRGQRTEEKVDALTEKVDALLKALADSGK